ncbi:receptor-like protein EIX2 [Lactuca sativa]|uniref:receptor-like protein EIX2 n=1 Tax=Lactuca sativa TaxID=4236 RepID=UPI0022B04853|nr:receptor-like protein EIX2 [Lactuca sativa]
MTCNIEEKSFWVELGADLVKCDGVTGNVQRLHLKGDYFYDYLVGKKVSSSLAELRHLKYLDLSGNRFFFFFFFFEGSHIPEFIGSLKHRSYLNLSYAGFGDDMAWAFSLSSLQLLYLSAVDLSRAQNWDMVLHMIPSLKYLHLRYNSCKGGSLCMNNSYQRRGRF